nr:hypothetical protein [Tanacetum cinerariifolium]
MKAFIEGKVNKKPGEEGGLLKKLDIVLGNIYFMSSFPLSYAHFLLYMLSDHSSAVLVIPRIDSVKPKPLKFHNYLTSKDGFIPVVKRVWNNKVDGFSMFSLVSKLKMLKKPLRKFSFEQGNLFDNVKFLKANLAYVQAAINADPHNNTLREDELRVLKAYRAALKDEESFLRQKSKVEWLNAGDRNSKYFHNVLKGKRNRNIISYVEDMDGNPFYGSSVGDQFIRHFMNVLGKCSKVSPIYDPSYLFLKKLSDADALFMVRSISDEEIKSALVDIDGNKAPGPDEFFANGKLLKEVNATVISLVPKVASPSKVSEFRPIACRNVVYKIISKIICNKIKGVLGSLVSENQIAFIPSRQISDNILLSQELMRNYHRNRGPAKCAFKSDIKKAYDSVEWEFLANCLKHFGFHKILIKWVMSCISSTSFTTNVNGDHMGFFKGMHGLRQGDPLSPYLFTLVMEVFNLVLKREIDRILSFKYHWLCKELKLTHLCFADHLLLFCNGDSIYVAVLNKVLKEFGGMSGLLPNITKNIVFYGNVKEISRQRILNIMPFREGYLPVMYLGVPLISKRLYIKDCQLLIDKARKRVLDWKNKSLSFAGRLQHTKSIVSSMQVYWASMFILLISISDEIGKLMRDFLWNFGVFKRGKAKVNWNSFCKPKVEGGLGIISLASWNIALMSRHIWNIITHKESFWVRWINTYRLKGRSFWDVPEKDGAKIVAFGLSLNVMVADVIQKGIWNWPVNISNCFDALNVISPPCLTDGKPDKVVWISSKGQSLNFSVSSVWNDIKSCGVPVPCHNHLFFECEFPKSIWCALKCLERNLRTFQNRFKSMDELCILIKDVVRLRIMGLSLKASDQVFVAANMWKFHVNMVPGAKRVNFASWKNQV